MMLPYYPRLKKLLRITAIVSMALLTVCSLPAAAQELEPRTYANTAIGVNLIGANAGFSNGNILLDPSLPIEGLKGDVYYGILRYMRSFGLFDRSAKLKVLLPFTTGDWDGVFEGEPAQRSSSGTGDIRVSLEWNFYGAPAMTAKELRSYQQKTIIGARIRMIIPTGDYDNTEHINLGSNRWSYQLEIGASRPFGAWSVEGMANIWFFGNNDDFLEGNYLQQEELWVIKTHLIYTFRPGFWIGSGIGYGNGGRTIVNGVPKDNRQENWRIGATIAYPVSRQHGISLTIGSGFNQGAGGDFDTIAIGYQYAWGEI